MRSNQVSPAEQKRGDHSRREATQQYRRAPNEKCDSSKSESRKSPSIKGHPDSLRGWRNKKVICIFVIKSID